MSILSDFSEEIKTQMKADYLAGMSLGEIAQKNGLKNREGIYYYIRPLTPQDKATHILNFYKRQEVEKGEQNVQV